MSASLDVFLASLSGDCPPCRLPPPLAGLWLGMKGRWSDAHSVIEDDDDPDSALVHAWLHRIEGDETNARLWYSKAGITPVWRNCDEEAKAIARHLIDG